MAICKASRLTSFQLRTDNQNSQELLQDWDLVGAGAGEPTALVRFGEKTDEAALSEPDAAKSEAQLLESFEYYAAAAERARNEDWPDDAWRNWRYRRASLARLLAKE